MSDLRSAKPVFRASGSALSRRDNVSPSLRASDPELASFLENLYARNLPEMEEAAAIREFVWERQGSRSAA